MSGLLNISGTAQNDDPSFRYKMPRLMSKIEGRGNGIKTIIPNMVEIATSLNRPPTLPTKFFGCELGAQTRWEAEAEKSTVNGAHTAQVLQHLLNVFIDKFVLCPKCHLPETALVVKKGLIQHKCSACGAKEAVDMSHKLCTFILKEASGAAAASAPTKEERKAAKKAKKEAEAKAAADGTGPAEGEGEKKAKKEKKEKKDKSEKKSKDKKKDKDAAAPVASAAPADSDSEGSSESEDEAPPRKAAASAPAPAASSGKASKRVASPEFESESEGEVATGGDEYDEETVAELRSFLKDEPAPSTEAVLAEVRRLQVASAAHPTTRAALFARAVLDGHAQTAATNAHLASATMAACKAKSTLAPLRQLLYSKDAPALGLSQTALLGAIVGIIATHAEALLRATPVLLQALYDGDVLEEEALVEWAEGKAGGAAAEPVRAAAEPFINWLTEAEEEDEDEEDDE